MSAVADKTKAEQRARTRRNQQRCRERKRAHIEELEKQVDALQAKIRQCEPCPTSCLPEPESALDTALRENAARRDLLSALGFDEGAQERFIASDAKRQAVRTILQEQGHQISSPHTPSGSLAETPPAPHRPSDLTSIVPANALAGIGPANSQAVDGFAGDGVDWSKIMMDYEQSGANFNVDDWLSDPQALNNLPSPLMDPPGNDPRLPGSFIDPVNDAQGAIDGVDLMDASTSSTSIAKPLNGDAPDGAQHTPQPPSDQAVDRCFLDTVVQFQAGETFTVCSKALSMIFRHNRKGLSMADLQRGLKAGIRIPFGASEECQIEDSVLFRVLADIST